ncbi:MAG: hypothetical protein AABY41_01925 [Nitrospirota bacterium]
MYSDSVQSMTGKKVRVIANDIVYNGLLVEVTETTVELQGEGQWITIPVDSISSITPIVSP